MPLMMFSIASAVLQGWTQKHGMSEIGWFLSIVRELILRILEKRRHNTYRHADCSQNTYSFHFSLEMPWYHQIVDSLEVSGSSG